MDIKVLWTIANSMGTVSDIKMLEDSKSFNIDVVTADRVDKDSGGFIYAGKKYIVPSGYEDGYIDAILEICDKEGITTIIPQYGDELCVMSRNMKYFSRLGIKILVTEDTDKLSIANNKIKLYDYFKDRDFIPQYEVVNDIDNMVEAVYNMGYPRRPVCLKPADGEGGRGFKIITPKAADIFNLEPAAPSINLDILRQHVKITGYIPELIVMEYLPGREYSVDCVCKEGSTYICIPRQRIETSQGAATVSIVEENRDIIEYSKEIISNLKLSYNINLQFKYSNDGRPKLIEINPRVSGSLVANQGAGVNMLEHSLRLAYGMQFIEPEIKWGTKMIRYWEQMYI